MINFITPKTYLKTGQKYIFIILILILATILWKNIPFLNLNLILEYKSLTTLLLTLSLTFISLKSLQLYLAGKLFHINESFIHFWKIYCMSSFIELTTFTGKIGSDGFKYLYWNNPHENKLHLLYFQRSADIMGFLSILIFSFLPIYITILLIAIILIIFISQRRNISLQSHSPISFLKTIKQHWLIWIILVILSLISYIIIITQLSLILSIFELTINKQLFVIILTSHGLGAISQLPLGLGIKDFSLFYQLKPLISQHDMIISLVWMRICSELPSVILGGIFLALNIKKK